MAGILGRLLIIDDQRDFARLLGAIAERLGFTTRILQHTLDLKYVMQHWHPDVIAIHMAMPDQQEIEVLNYLEKIRFPGRLLMTGNVSLKALEDAAKIGRQNGLAVASVMTKSSSSDEIEAALKLVLGLERAA
jgi:CheY-like chemotaxis protein